MTSCLREPSISSFRGVPRHSPPSQRIWLTASATPLAKSNAIDIEANNRTTRLIVITFPCWASQARYRPRRSACLCSGCILPTDHRTAHHPNGQFLQPNGHDPRVHVCTRRDRTEYTTDEQQHAVGALLGLRLRVVRTIAHVQGPLNGPTRGKKVDPC